MASPQEKLYNAVTSGQVKLDSLNDDGKNALKEYVTAKQLREKGQQTPSLANFKRMEDNLDPSIPLAIGKKVAEQNPPKKGGLLGFYDSLQKSVVEPTDNLLRNTKVGQGAVNVIDGVGDGLTLGAYTHERAKTDSQFGDYTTGNKLLDTGLNLGGLLLGAGGTVGASYKTLGAAGEKLGKSLLPKLTANKTAQKLGTEALRGAGAGIAEMGARELVDSVYTDKSVGDRLGNVALGGAIGAVGDPLLMGAGALLKNAKNNKELKQFITQNSDAFTPKELSKLTKPELKDVAKMVNEDLTKPIKPLELAKNEVAATIESPKLPSQQIEDKIAKGIPLTKAEEHFNNTYLNKSTNYKKMTEVQMLDDVKPSKPKEDYTSEEWRKIVNEEAADITENSALWKDKTKPFLKRETMDRNFEDIMGKDAPQMIETYIAPVKKAETERIVFLNKERNEIRELGIKPKSLDDQLVQKYGEGLLTLDELKQQTPNWKKVVKATEVFREKYDKFLDTVNEVLKRNGHQQIPKRKDYFPHYEEMDGIIAKLGIGGEDFTLPTDINGLTQDFKPTKNFFNFALRRTGDKTTYGASEGFDRYIDGVSKLIHHTDNIKRLRALENEVRFKYAGDKHLTNFVSELKEYTNNLAGKKAMMDRGVEDVVGRKVYSVFDQMRKSVGANMIGANIAAALTNPISLNYSLATTNKKAFAKGMFDSIKNVFKNDGFIQKSEFLTRRAGSDPLYRNLWDKSIDKSMWFMKSSDMFVSQIMVRSKYLENIGKGMPAKQAIKHADDWAARIVGDRSLGSTPTAFNSKVLGVFTQFQLEVNNQVSFIFKDIPRNFDKKGVASALGQVFLYSYLYNELYEKATGRRVAFDPIGIAENAFKDYSNPNMETTQATKNMVDNINNLVPFSSLLTGGRFPISKAIPHPIKPFTGEGNVVDDVIKPLGFYAFPTSLNQGLKMYEGTKAMVNEGVYNENAKGEKSLRYPVERNAENIAKSLVFGPSSYDETRDYYDNNRRPLSVQQTEKYLNAPEKEQFYNALLDQRMREKYKNKIADIKKDKTMPVEEKKKKIDKLIAEVEGIVNAK